MGIMADIDEVMYSCGMEILHPGGIAKSVEMAEKCGISENSNVLDIGSGKGATACVLAHNYGCRITGIDENPEMSEYSRDKAWGLGLSGKADFIQADAYDLPFADDSFDIVLAECSTVLLDKNRVFNEMIRTAKPGAFIADLEMTWQKPAPTALTKQVWELWDGFSTMTLPEWETFFRTNGLTEIQSSDFSDKLDDMEKVMMKELGLPGLLRLTGRLISNPLLFRALIEYRKIFKTWSDYIGYGYIVGRK
ncbi:MAG: methyltransferase domain-containing protein [Spirochaetales bacterium]|nr:methyltransferase domain-containing protein [Spirochaetales bacterium]